MLQVYPPQWYTRSYSLEMPLSLGAFCRDATVQSEMFGVV